MRHLWRLDWIGARYHPTPGRRHWLGSRHGRLENGGWYLTVAGGLFGRGVYVGVIRPVRLSRQLERVIR